MQAHIERLATFAQHGQPKDYAASDMMRADLEALIMQAIAQPVQPANEVNKRLAEQCGRLQHEVDATQLAFEHWRDECADLTNRLHDADQSIGNLERNIAVLQANIAQPEQPDEQAAFETWLADKCPSGDVSNVQRQWEASSAYAAIAQPMDKLLTIIASAYQICGAHDAPEHVLDVLANPTMATRAQIDALLPYMPAPVRQPLTDVDIEKCVEKVWGSFAEFDEVRSFTRAIEAAHGIGEPL